MSAKSSDGLCYPFLTHLLVLNFGSYCQKLLQLMFRGSLKQGFTKSLRAAKQWKASGLDSLESGQCVREILSMIFAALAHFASCFPAPFCRHCQCLPFLLPIFNPQQLGTSRNDVQSGRNIRSLSVLILPTLTNGSGWPDQALVPMIWKSLPWVTSAVSYSTQDAASQSRGCPARCQYGWC